MDFTGIDAIEGTYEIILNEAVSDYEIVRVAATNNYQTEYASNYCLFVQIYAVYLPSTACEIAFYIRWKLQNLGSGTNCMDLEDVDFETASATWAFTNDNFAAYLPVCESDSGTVNAVIREDLNGECDTEYYTFDWAVSYV